MLYATTDLDGIYYLESREELQVKDILMFNIEGELNLYRVSDLDGGYPKSIRKHLFDNEDQSLFVNLRRLKFTNVDTMEGKHEWKVTFEGGDSMTLTGKSRPSKNQVLAINGAPYKVLEVTKDKEKGSKKLFIKVETAYDVSCKVKYHRNKNNTLKFYDTYKELLFDR